MKSIFGFALALVCLCTAELASSAPGTGIPPVPGAETAGTAAPADAAGAAASARGANVGAAVVKACESLKSKLCKADDHECEAQKSACLKLPAPALAVRAGSPDTDCKNPASSCFPSYWRRHQVDLKKLAEASNSQDLIRATGGAREVAGEDVAFAAIGGLQSFLTDRAKAETMSYAVDQLKGQICKHDANYLEATCALLNQSDLELDDATLLRFKIALQQDFLKLPGVVFSRLPAATSAEDAAVRIFALSGLETVAETATGSLSPQMIPVTWQTKDKQRFATATSKVQCALAGGSMAGACWALFLPELGKAAVDVAGADAQGFAWTPENLAAALEQASVSFCSTYGALGKTADGACILESPTQIDQLLGKLQILARASVRFVELQKSVELLAKAGTPPAELAARMLPEYADAFDQWGAAFKALVPAGSGAVTTIFPRIGVSLRAIGAAAGRDYAAFVAIVSDSLQPGQPFDGIIELPPKLIEGLGFAGRLAAAKTPDDAKKVFDEAAAPLGSYKMKYGRETYTIALNAYVGTFLGGGPYFKHAGDKASGVAFRPLSAPLGLDWTAPSWKYGHLGMLLSVIDPFAAGTLNSSSKAEDFDWGSVFAPGLFFRAGIGRSPFTVLVGAAAQPFAKSNEECTTSSGGSSPCWKGQFQFGGAIAVDVPLLVLH